MSRDTHPVLATISSARGLSPDLVCIHLEGHVRCETCRHGFATLACQSVVSAPIHPSRDEPKTIPTQLACVLCDTNNRIDKEHTRSTEADPVLTAGQGARQHPMACPAPQSAIIPNKPNLPDHDQPGRLSTTPTNPRPDFANRSIASQANGADDAENHPRGKPAGTNSNPDPGSEEPMSSQDPEAGWVRRPKQPMLPGMDETIQGLP